MNNEPSNYRKLLLLFGFGVVTLAIYHLSSPKTRTTQCETISVKKSRPSTISGFYHFATVGSHWKQVVYEQMLTAFLSGLIEASADVYVTGLGNTQNNKTAFDMFANSKFLYEYDTRTNLYEFPILKRLEAFCVYHNDSLVWYAHSKGVTHSPDSPIASWRHVMNYFVLEKWQYCKERLSSTNSTTCGAILTFDRIRKAGWNKYYAGNMWWAKCSHVNRLTRIDKLDQSDRYIAELYVTSEPDVGHFNCIFINMALGVSFNRENQNCTINQPLWWVR